MIFPLLKLTEREAMVKVLLNLYTCIQGVVYQILPTLICTEDHLRLLGDGVGGGDYWLYLLSTHFKMNINETATFSNLKKLNIFSC